MAALVALVATLLLAAGPAAGEASAGPTACKRFGNTPAFKLRNRPARKAVVCLLNKQRKQAGVPKLDRSRKLQRAAQKHTERMQRNDCFSHQCSGEASLEERLRKVGYLVGGLLRWAYGENIAWGLGDRSTPRNVVRAWMNSSGHRANILNGTFREVGIGTVDGSPYSRGAKGAVFTTDFGLRLG